MQLLRLLEMIFGEERVIYNMSAFLISGNSPTSLDVAWAKDTKCLFTVVDYDDTPKLVIDFAASDSALEVIDTTLLAIQEQLSSYLFKAGIRYIKIKMSDFNDVLDPENELTLTEVITRSCLNNERSL